MGGAGPPTIVPHPVGFECRLQPLGPCLKSARARQRLNIFAVLAVAQICAELCKSIAINKSLIERDLFGAMRSPRRFLHLISC
jgi:hypothetical protein